MNISKGIKKGAVKIVIYGPEGIGKSTFASKFPGAVFIDTEGSTKYLDVARFEGITNWDSILGAVEHVIKDHSDIGTLVVDTADWAELMAIKKVCENCHVKGIEDIGYGKGYVYLQETFKQLLDLLEKCIYAGVNIVITAHAKMRKFEQPDEMGAYDRWEMKLTKQVAPMVKEWADAVFFANYKTLVIEDSKTKSKKATGGTRVMFTTHHPCWDAKNRFGLSDQLDFNFKEIAKIVSDKPETEVKEPEKNPFLQIPENPEIEIPWEAKTAYDELKEILEKNRITEEEVQAACTNKNLQPGDVEVKDYSEEFIREMLIAKFDGFKSYIEKQIKGIPFIKHYENTKGAKKQ